jgi:hypothetical protein
MCERLRKHIAEARRPRAEMYQCVRSDEYGKSKREKNLSDGIGTTVRIGEGTTVRIGEGKKLADG